MQRLGLVLAPGFLGSPAKHAAKWCGQFMRKVSLEGKKQRFRGAAFFEVALMSMAHGTTPAFPGFCAAWKSDKTARLFHQANKRTPIPIKFDGGGQAGDFPWAPLTNLAKKQRKQTKSCVRTPRTKFLLPIRVSENWTLAPDGGQTKAALPRKMPRPRRRSDRGAGQERRSRQSHDLRRC